MLVLFEWTIFDEKPGISSAESPRAFSLTKKHIEYTLKNRLREQIKELELFNNIKYRIYIRRELEYLLKEFKNKRLGSEYHIYDLNEEQLSYIILKYLN